MARKVKCPYCEGMQDKEDAVEYKKRYYHEECINTWRSEVEHRKELIDYICDLYKLDAPTGMILKQIKSFVEEYKYKYKGIELALRYFHDTLDNKVREGDSIGIVPFVYEEAKKHYIKQLAIKEKARDENNHKNVEHVVFIKPPDRKIQNIIDISSI